MTIEQLNILIFVFVVLLGMLIVYTNTIGRKEGNDDWDQEQF